MSSNTKGFLALLVAVLVLGGSLGGAFAGGVAVGRGQGGEETSGAVVAPTLSTPGPSQQSPGQFDPAQLDQLRQQLRSGEIDPEQLNRLRRQFQDGRGFGGGGGGLTGVIDRVEGDTITVETQQGPLQAIMGEDTIIQMSVQGALEDLGEGLWVTVIGQRGEDGTVQARSIVIIPEGVEGFFGGGSFSGDHLPQEVPSP